MPKTAKSRFLYLALYTFTICANVHVHVYSYNISSFSEKYTQNVGKKLG
jgi:hypothetical protein